MRVVALEVRDRGTFIPVFAVSMIGFNDAQQDLLRRAGYGAGNLLIALTRMELPSMCEYDPANWRDRTMQVAHKYITDHFHKLHNGDVVDVEFILGETTEPKKKEYEYDRRTS